MKIPAILFAMMLFWTTTALAYPTGEPKSLQDLETAKTLLKEKKPDEAKPLLLGIAYNQDLDKKTRASAFFYLSYCAEDNKSKRDYAENVLVYDTENPLYYYRLAEIQYAQRDIDAALKNVSVAIDMARLTYHKNIYDFYVLSASCYLKKGDYPTASAQAERAIRLQQDKANAHFIRGKANFLLFVTAKYDTKPEAQSDFEAVIKSSDGEAYKGESYLYLGKIAEYSRQIEAALTAYTHALPYYEKDIPDMPANERLAMKERLMMKIRSLQTTLKWNS